MFKRLACVIVTSIVLTATLLAVMVSSCHPISASQSWEPIEIVSVLGPVPPFTPGGPAVEITLKNVSVEPVISLTATLELSESFDFTFDDVSPSNPLQPNRSTSDRLTLIGGGFSSDVSYPLTINATLRNGAKFVYTKLVQIVEPPPNIGGIFAIIRQIWGPVLAGVICAPFQPYVAVLAILPIIYVYLTKVSSDSMTVSPYPWGIRVTPALNGSVTNRPADIML